MEAFVLTDDDTGALPMTRAARKELGSTRERLIEMSLKWIAEHGGLLPSSQVGISEHGPMIADIQRATCEHFEIRAIDLISRRRTKKVVVPRQIAMFLSRKLTTQSLPQISKKFGGRDHTTVVHAIKKIELLEQQDAALDADISAIEAALGVGDAS